MKLQIVLLISIGLLFTACMLRPFHGHKRANVDKPITVNPAIKVPLSVTIG